MASKKSKDGKLTPLGEFARRNALQIEFTQVAKRPDGVEWKGVGSHWRYVVRRTDGRAVCEIGGHYSMGAAHKGKPDPDDLLYSLYVDASSVDGSFEDFCSNMGYDSDSRKAEQIYRACVGTRKKLADCLVSLDGLAAAIEEQGL